MADNASGPDRSVQVKLVLLGTSSKIGTFWPHIPHERAHFSLTNLPGEAAVGKSSVVLRFVRVSSGSKTSLFRPFIHSASL